MEVVQRRLAYKKPEGWKSDQKKDIIPEERKNLKNLKRRREQFEIIPEDWKQETKGENLNVETYTTITQFSRSPVKDLIQTFELLSRKNLEGPDKSGCSGKNKTDIPAVRTDVQETRVKQNIPVGRKEEKLLPAKKVWTKLKSGLFGWSTVGRAKKQSTGTNSRTPGKLKVAQTVSKSCLPNNVSETRQKIPQKIMIFFLGGGGKRGHLLTKKRKYLQLINYIWREIIELLRWIVKVTGSKRKCGNIKDLLTDISSRQQPHLQLLCLCFVFIIVTNIFIFTEVNRSHTR